jgi:hypothetical protein
MENLLKLKAQYIFTLLILPWIISVFIYNPFMYDLINIIGYFIYFALLIIFYDFLFQLFKRKIGFEYIFFIIVCIVFLITYTFIAIAFEEGEGLELKGLIGFFVAIIYFLAFGFIFYTLSVNLLKAENKKMKREYVFNYFILFLVLPIGIWFLMPKFQKLINIESESQ